MRAHGKIAAKSRVASVVDSMLIADTNMNNTIVGVGVKNMSYSYLRTWSR